MRHRPKLARVIGFIVNFSLSCTIACSSGKLRLDPADSGQLSLDEIASSRVVKGQAASTNVATSPPADENSEVSALPSSCSERLSLFSAPLQKLLPYAQGGPLANSAAVKIAQSTSVACDGINASASLALTEQILNAKPQRIGLILPLSAGRTELAQAVLEGAREAASKLGRDFSGLFVIKDSRGTSEGTLTALADLVFYDDIATVIGGLTGQEASVMSAYASGLVTPMFIVNKDPEFARHDKYAFQVFPNEFDLARSLIKTAALRRWKRVGVLRPDHGRSDYMIKGFRAFAAKSGIDTSEEYSYHPGDYDSMNRATASIAHTSHEGRESEYLSILKTKQEESKTAGQSFDIRSVILRARTKVDALFIPDHYRNVHYFVKLLKYQGIEKMPLVGSHLWRSEDLLRPWEPFLEGSIFGDFIGNYNEIPVAGVKVAAVAGSFIATSEVTKIDLRLLGFRSASLALNLVGEGGLKRRDLLGRLPLLQDNEGFFRSTQAFSPERSTYWPTFIFSIGKKAVELVAQYPGGGS